MAFALLPSVYVFRASDAQHVLVAGRIHTVAASRWLLRVSSRTARKGPTSADHAIRPPAALPRKITHAAKDNALSDDCYLWRQTYLWRCHPLPCRRRQIARSATKPRLDVKAENDRQDLGQALSRPHKGGGCSLLIRSLDSSLHDAWKLELL